ncbi:MAG: hypothetical protein JO134_04315 [Xanthobacteraceae bacterium]|nr:hypothetical protein [Xanthobacteraceae bacterium]
MTVLLVVLGRHVERFEFLDVMLGDRPALSPSELFYQRMLADDPAEAVDKAEEFLKERPLSNYYDDVALPGLRLAQSDVARGALDRAQADAIKASVAEVVDDLSDQNDRIPVSETTSDAEATAALESTSDPALDLPVVEKDQRAPGWQSEAPVLCVPGRGPLDEAVAVMLTQLLDKHGLHARVEGVEAVAGININYLDTTGVAMVCVSYLDSSSPAHMRYTIRRLRRRFPGARIMLGCWLANADTAGEAAKADDIAVTLRDAVRLCLEAARKPGLQVPTTPDAGIAVDAA